MQENQKIFSRPTGELSRLEESLAAYIESLEEKGLLTQRDAPIAYLVMDLAGATAQAAADGKASSSGTAKMLMEVYDRLPNPDAPQGLAALLGDDDDDEEY